MRKCLTIGFILGIILLFIGMGTTSAINNIVLENQGQQSEVFVDDDFDETTPGWGYDHFDNIQDGLDNVSDSGTVHVYEGTYDVFNVQARSNIIIQSAESVKPIVQGNQNVLDFTINPPVIVKNVVFVDNSDNIILKELNIQGIGLTGRSYAVFYNSSSGKIDACNISPNQRGNMNSLAVRVQLDSTLSVENCTILNYGRIGIYCRTGSITNILHNTFIGQIYTDSDGDFVSYGIEVENLGSASHATILYNEIYDHDHTGTPSWTSAGIIIDVWRYYQVTSENCSAIIEYNDIHDNMVGLQIIPNENINVNLNTIHNNGWGAVSDPYWNGSAHVYVDLDAVNNWWGDETGPYHPTENPSGTGNEVSDYVIFAPWLEDYLPTIEIINPQEGFLYLNFRDIIEFKLPFIATMIFGKNDIEAVVTKGLFEINRVEFYIDDKLKGTVENEPYEWTWEELTPFFQYTIKTVVYDTEGNQRFDDIKVWKSHYL